MSEFLRDQASGALINTETAKYNMHKLHRAQVKVMKNLSDKVILLEGRIEYLENKIKTLEENR